LGALPKAPVPGLKTTALNYRYSTKAYPPYKKKLKMKNSEKLHVMEH